MEFEIILLAAVIAAARGIIVSDPVPLTYTINGGYASQYAIPSTLLNQGPGVVYNSVLRQNSKSEEGGQYSAAYPTIHHPAEYTYASPPVRHAEPINYPVPPAPVREPSQEPTPTEVPFLARFATYGVPLAAPVSSGLLGVAYSPASVVSRMSYTNNYGVSYGY